MMNIASRLLDIYRRSPSATAIHLLTNQQPDRAISYAELVLGAAGYTTMLQAAGIQPGEVVILILPHGADLVYAFFGAILHGSIPSIMPFLTEKLSPEQYRLSLVALFKITSPAAVITYPDFIEEVHTALQLGGSVRAVLSSDQVQPQAELQPGLLENGVNQPGAEITLLQHSSGTTGLQKGVALSHQAVFNQLDAYTQAIQLTPGDVIASWLPLYHDMGLIAGFILPILSQVPLVLLSPFDWVRAPQLLFQAVTRYRGTLSWLPNFAYNFCSQKIRPRDLEGIDLSSWRAVINCSEPIYWSSHQMFLERFEPFGLKASALATCYAMAENVFAVSQGGISSPAILDVISQRSLMVDRLALPAQDAADSLTLVSSGQAILNTCLKVLNEHHSPVPDRHIGEIAISSDCMLSGYYHRPDLSAKAFTNGWYLTGDLGYLVGDEIFVTGRKKDLIIVGGKNVYPQDLERLASEVPGVHPGRVVAFGVPNPSSGTEDVVLIAELEKAQAGDESSSPELDRISNEIRLRVNRGSDIALRYVKLVKRGWLLKTSSGKVARSANRERYLAELTAG